MVLILIGIGIIEPKNITIKGLEAIKSCRNVYLYASIYQPYDKENLEKYLDQKLPVIDEANVLSKMQDLVIEGNNYNIALLTPGDPFCDNLYPKLKLACVKHGTNLKIVHNACLLNSISNSGLQLYRFGKTLYGYDLEHKHGLLNIAKENISNDLHTLILLDPVSNIFSSLTKDLAEAGIPEVLGSILEKGSTDPVSYGVVLVTSDSCNLKIHGPIPFNSDFSNFDTTTVRALIITATLHEMEETVLSFNSSPSHYFHEGRGTFHLIGLGLGQPEDITVEGKQVIMDSKKVYLEGYTSIMLGGKNLLEDYFGKEIIIADRELVESNSEEILQGLELGDVSFLVVGDPLGATTHTDLVIRAAKASSSINIIHNASIINAAAISGLKSDKFGEIVSIPFWEDSWKPDSFYDKICVNLEKGLHTLCLLDIKVKEQSLENIMRNRKIFEKPRYMTIAQASDILLKITEVRIKELNDNLFISDEMGDQCASILEGRSNNKCLTTSEQVDIACDQMNKIVQLKLGLDSIVPYNKIQADSEVICLGRVGTESEEIVVLSLHDAACLDLGGPLHSLIILGNKDKEEEMFLSLYRKNEGS